jgi:hypothetical protein
MSLHVISSRDRHVVITDFQEFKECYVDVIPSGTKSIQVFAKPSICPRIERRHMHTDNIVMW